MSIRFFMRRYWPPRAISSWMTASNDSEIACVRKLARLADMIGSTVLALMRRDQCDEPGQLLDLAGGLAQAGRMILGIDARAGERGTLDHAVEQPRQAWQDRDV